MFSSRGEKAAAAKEENKQPIATIKRKTGKPFTLEQLSTEISRSVEEAKNPVGLGVSTGVYEAAGEGLYRMIRDALEAHEKIANRVKTRF